MSTNVAAHARPARTTQPHGRRRVVGGGQAINLVAAEQAVRDLLPSDHDGARLSAVGRGVRCLSTAQPTPESAWRSADRHHDDVVVRFIVTDEVLHHLATDELGHVGPDRRSQSSHSFV